MNEKKVSWDEFEKEALLASEQNDPRAPLFRGQRVGEWKLQTTLERFGCPDYRILHYHRDVHSAAVAIETVTGKKADVSEAPTGDYDPHQPPEDYSYLAYLRQHGFPSPLLDWSRSPYVAAFFAFHHANPLETEFVSVFEFRQGTAPATSSDEASICALGPWIATDKKHFLQQSWYTVSRKHNDRGPVYTSHDEAFAKDTEGDPRLRKFLIPISEQHRVLKKLKLMNITSYSLFETVEGLMETLAPELLRRSGGAAGMS